MYTIQNDKVIVVLEARTATIESKNTGHFQRLSAEDHETDGAFKVRVAGQLQVRYNLDLLVMILDDMMGHINQARAEDGELECGESSPMGQVTQVKLMAERMLIEDFIRDLKSDMSRHDLIAQWYGELAANEKRRQENEKKNEVMKCKCRICGDVFNPNRETESLCRNGYIDRPDICDECAGKYEDDEPLYDFSDADPGL